MRASEISTATGSVVALIVNFDGRETAYGSGLLKAPRLNELSIVLSYLFQFRSTLRLLLSCHVCSPCSPMRFGDETAIFRLSTLQISRQK